MVNLTYEIVYVRTALGMVYVCLCCARIRIKWLKTFLDWLRLETYFTNICAKNLPSKYKIEVKSILKDFAQYSKLKPEVL